jgi:hypothetical protein
MNAHTLYTNYLRALGSPRAFLPLADTPRDLLTRLGAWYDSAKDTSRQPATAKAYAALAGETREQFAALTGAGLRVIPWRCSGQPYETSAAMREDVAKRGRLFFFPTASGFGEAPSSKGNLLLAPTPFRAGGEALCVNDLFRVVHDIFGHCAHGLGFGALGELNAFRAHSLLFSETALPALACETAAQNAWVNFGPHLPHTLPAAARPYAAQKNTAVPPELLSALLLLSPSPAFLGGVGVK